MNRRKLFQTLLKIFANFSRFLHKILSLNHFYYFIQNNQFGRIAHPSVIDAISFVDSEIILVIISSGENLLRKGDNIRRVGKIPLFVRPKCATRSSARLNLIHNKSNVIFLANFLQSPEELLRRVKIASFALNWLDDESRHIAFFTFLFFD